MLRWGRSHTSLCCPFLPEWGPLMSTYLIGQANEGRNPRQWVESFLEETATKSHEMWLSWGVAALAVCGTAVCAVIGMRLYFGWRARGRRKTVAMVPSSKFDPSDEEVLRFCGQLSRVRSAAARFTRPASTRTVRVSLVSAGEGRMAQLVSGPEAAGQLLRKRGFAQVELSDPVSVLTRPGSGPGVTDDVADVESSSEGGEISEMPAGPAHSFVSVGDDGPWPFDDSGRDEWGAGDVADDVAADMWDVDPVDRGAPVDAGAYVHPEELVAESSSRWACLEEES